MPCSGCAGLLYQKFPQLGNLIALSFVWFTGISYLSRAQESAAKGLIGDPIPGICQAPSASSSSVADTIFIERIKSRVRHWRDACQNSNKTTDG